MSTCEHNFRYSQSCMSRCGHLVEHMISYIYMTKNSTALLVHCSSPDTGLAHTHGVYGSMYSLVEFGSHSGSLVF
jgi:hypothetical protein